MRNGLIAHQQNLTPNDARIDELTTSNPTSPPTIPPDKAGARRGHGNQNSESIDLGTLHQQIHTSKPYGAPVSDWECFIAMLHSVDAGFHLGLLVEMVRDSVGWNLQEQYLFVCVFILVIYRVVSYLMVYFHLPRYSYSKTVQRSQQQSEADLPDVDLASDPEAKDSRRNSMSAASNASSGSHQRQNSEVPNLPNQRSLFSYCLLQLLFDFGYIMELAPWLWNWEQSKIVLPEFAWFSKMRTLLQSFPFAVLMVISLLSIDNVSEHIHFYFIASLTLSLSTIVLSLTLYDHRTLDVQDLENAGSRCSKFSLFGCNVLYRFFSACSRIIILSFLIAMFPWYCLFLILLIPVVAYSGPYQLGHMDAEPLNLLYQSLLVFPDYSVPFGKVPQSENYLNRIRKGHMILIIVFGSPLIAIFFIVETVMKRVLKIDKDAISMDKAKYASYKITTYTLSRFVESLIELLIIFTELYHPAFESRLLIKDVTLVHSLFWMAVVMSVCAPIPFRKLYNEFVVDNEEDYELGYGIHGANDDLDGKKRESDYIMSNDEYNMQHNFVDVGNGQSGGGHHAHSSRNSGNSAILTSTSNPMAEAQHHVNTKQDIHGHIDIRGSRQYLRQKQYWIAVHRNNYKELAWTLRSRQHVNLLDRNDQEQMGIIIVALRHDWDCLTLLVRHGGGLRHLLRYAALHGEVDILKFLHSTLGIKIGHIRDNADELLLFSAIEGSQSKVVKLLVRYGASLKEMSTEGNSPTILAAKQAELDILKIFGENGVDLTVNDELGNTVAHYASQVYNGKHILKYLHKLYKGKRVGVKSEHSTYGDDGTCLGFNFNSQNKRGATAAYLAAYQGQMENMEVLREVGADFTLSNNDSNNCLIGAAMNDQPMIVNYLLDDCKMEVDYANDCQETALYWSASNGCIGCLKALISHKANLEKQDKYGITALVAAAEHGEAAALEVLLDAGANGNHQNQDGETALMKSCAEGYLDCVKALIAHKVDYRIRDDEGNPAILWCCMTGNMEIFEYLVLDALKLSKEHIETTVNKDQETCIDWIVENKLERGLQVLDKLGIDISEAEDDDDDYPRDDDDYDDDDEEEDAIEAR